MKFTNGFGVTKSAITTSCIIALCLSISALASSGSRKSSSNFQIHYPDLTALQDSCRSGIEDPCAVETQLLTQALADLEIARTNAENAYAAWYECVIENGGNPNPTPVPAVTQQDKSSTTTFSILERSN